ncbi:hypothetical protein ACOSP7_026747 [Xanthoceras sorbifolium]
MALTKFQLATILLFSLALLYQSTGTVGIDVGSQCDLTGDCSKGENCSEQCVKIGHPADRALCVVDPSDHSLRCCCFKTK